MDHADVDAIDTEGFELTFEAGLDLLEIARPQILPVLPDGAEMTLDDELLAPPG